MGVIGGCGAGINSVIGASVTSVSGGDLAPPGSPNQTRSEHLGMREHPINGSSACDQAVSEH
jgi:hypothetical protein